MSVRNGSRRVRSQRDDWGTMGPALGGAYECYAHISSFPCQGWILKIYVKVFQRKATSEKLLVCTRSEGDRLIAKAGPRPTRKNTEELFSKTLPVPIVIYWWVAQNNSNNNRIGVSLEKGLLFCDGARGHDARILSNSNE